MASTIPEQYRAVDPFASYNSNTINQLTEVRTRGENRLDIPSGLNVIVDTTSPLTAVVVQPGYAFKDDVIISVTEEHRVNFFDEDNYVDPPTIGDPIIAGWYYIVLEYTYIKSRPAPTAKVKIIRPADRSNDDYNSTSSSLIFLKAVYLSSGSPLIIDINSFSDYDPTLSENKREYTKSYAGTETQFEVTEHISTRDQSRIVYDISTDQFWFGYSNRWDKVGDSASINIDTTAVVAGQLCYVDSNAVAAAAIATSIDTGADMVAISIGTAVSYEGEAILSGYIEGVLIESSVVISVGDVLYLSDTDAGRVTNNRTSPSRQVVGRAMTAGNSSNPINIIFDPKDVLSIGISGTIESGDWLGPDGNGLYYDGINITSLDVDSTSPTVLVNIWDASNNRKVSPAEAEIISAGTSLKIYTTDNSVTWNYRISTGGGAGTGGGGGGGGGTDHAFLTSLDYASSGHTGFSENQHGNADHTAVFIEDTGVTFANLNSNGDVGNGASQVSQGNHGHTNVPHSDIIDDEAVKHRLINDGITSATALWSSNKINSELASVTPASSSVGQAQLKTSIQTQSQSIGTLSSKTFTLTGGQYILVPQFQTSLISMGVRFGDAGVGYATKITMSNPDGFSSYTGYVRQRYITASGEINWLFMLVDKETKEITGVSFAVDHPCFGNGQPEDYPHPFEYDSETHEVFLNNPAQEQVDGWNADSRDITDIVVEDYDVDESVSPDWPTDLVTIGLPFGAEDLPPGTTITPIKAVITQPDDVKTVGLKLKA